MRPEMSIAFGRAQCELRERMAQERLLSRVRQPADRFAGSEPADFTNVRRWIARRLVSCLHPPELNDLGAPTAFIRQRPDELLHRDSVSGLFEDFALGRTSAFFIRLQFAFGQDPMWVLPKTHDSEFKPSVVPKHKSACS
jgi:hypothetical protein